MTTHLLTHPTSHAAWIDTVGSFSPGFLKRVVEERIVCARMEVERQEDAVKGKLSVEEVSRMVEGVLDRVWVMRAFDLWGVIEAVGEVRGHVEANIEVKSNHDPGRDQEEEGAGVGCGEVDRKVDDKEDREGIERNWGSQCIWVTDPISLHHCQILHRSLRHRLLQNFSPPRQHSLLQAELKYQTVTPKVTRI